MPRIVWASLLFATATSVCLIMTATPHAQTFAAPAPHVRPQSSDMQALVAEAAARSALVRDLLDRLEQSDVVVYVRACLFKGSRLEGRIGLLSTVGTQRYLAIELAMPRPRHEQIATLAHELHHALEIAGQPSIVDARSLAAFYERVGMRLDGALGGRIFETSAARDTGYRARREVLTGGARTTHEQ